MVFAMRDRKKTDLLFLMAFGKKILLLLNGSTMNLWELKSLSLWKVLWKEFNKLFN